MGEDAESYFLVHCGGRRLGLALANIEEKLYLKALKRIETKNNN